MKFRLCSILAGALIFSAAAATFDAAGVKKRFTQAGFTETFLFEEGKLVYDSTNSKTPDKFRWARLAYPERVGGNVSVRFDWRIDFINHYNGLELEFRSTEKDAFSVVLRREQLSVGQQFVSAVVTVKGRETVKKQIPFGAYGGALLLSRENGKLTLQAENSRAERFNVLEIGDFPTGAANVSLKFTSAPHTRGRMEVVGVAIESSETFSTAYYPVFDPVRKLGDASVFGGEKVTRNPDGTWSVAPGGVLACAVRGEANMRSVQLRFFADGALKAACFQAGNREPAVTGEILLWDEDAPQNGFQERKIDLGSFLARYPWDRKWDYSLFSTAPSLLLEFTPSGDAPIRIGTPALYASTLRPAELLTGAAAPAAFDAAGILQPERRGESIELSGRRLPFRTGEPVAEEFPALRLKLDASTPVLTLPVNRAAASIDIVHTAGSQADGDAAACAAFQIGYDDGTTATEFFTLRWNAGVWHADFLKRGSGDYTWWGPVGFPRAEIHYLPTGKYGECYNAVYRTRIENPHPEKNIRQLTLYKLPQNRSEFLAVGLKLNDAAASIAAAVEPDRSVLTPGETVPFRVFGRSPDGASTPEGEYPVTLRRGDGAVSLGTVRLQKQDAFFWGRSNFTVPGDGELPPGPVRLAAAGFESVPLGLMPANSDGFHYTMIAGAFSPRPDFDRIRRIGYDTVKLVIPWNEAEEGRVEFPGSDRYTRWIRENGLRFSIRNHIRMNRGPKYFAEKAVFQTRYAPEKAPEERPQIDPADPWSVERIVNLYRETARFARDNDAIGINANYGLRPETGLNHIDMGKASLAMFRERLAQKYPLEKINAETGMKFASFDAIQPLDCYRDASGFLLKEYLTMHHENLARAQRAVTRTIRGEGYTGHLTYNVSFHPIEQKLIGANTGAYLALSREFPPGSLFHETSDRYCLSFVKYLAAKRTLGLPYGDEGCLTPPPDLANRIAFHWMAMMQCFDVITCQWFAGKPGMLGVAPLKPLHALLYDAEYLPDAFSLALSLDTGFDEAKETVRSTLHQRAASHYALANLLRELNLNADRYLIDAFPELDGNVRPGLLIDDITRSVRPEFGDRLEKFIRDGGVFLASAETDALNGHAFLRRFGIEPSEVAPGKVIRKNAGRGAVVFRNAPWRGAGWDPGLPEEQRRELLALLTREGGFQPLVKTDKADLFVTPYRAKNGDLLLHVINIRSAKTPVRVSWRIHPAEGSVYDHVSGRTHAPRRDGAYSSVEIELEPFQATVLRVSPEEVK